MRTIFIGAFGFLLVILFGPAPIQAQETSPKADAVEKRAFERPVTETGTEFVRRAKKRWQETDVEYLTKDADPALGPPRSDNAQSDRNRRNTPRVTTGQQVFAAIVVLILVAGLGYLFWRSQTGGLSNAAKREGRFARQDNALADEMLSEGDDISLPFDDLARTQDYKKGLRILLVQALTRAAEENRIPLRRSFTTRDVYKRVPPAWNNRDALRELIARAEPVLFGGRDIDQEGYAAAVQTVRPLLGNRSSGAVQ